MAGNPVLSVEGMSVAFQTEAGLLTVLDDVSFDIAPGETVGIVGESGSGKSVTSLAIMRLLGPQGRQTSGTVRLEGQEISAMSDRQMLAVRGRQAAMIFQEPMSSLNPLLSVGFQVAEVLRAHLGLSARQARSRVIEQLAKVGIPHPAARYHSYPHELSGGMRQRVMIAIAMACSPRLLIADEPTTALDVTIQAQILELMHRIQGENGSAIMLITHDMGVIARMADRVVVMYAGEVCEIGRLKDIFGQPRHPYTKRLLQSTPSVRGPRKAPAVIPGMMPSPAALPTGCRFHPRCSVAIAACLSSSPPLREMAPGHRARCWRADEMPGLIADFATAGAAA